MVLSTESVIKYFSDENVGCQGIIDLSAILYLKPVEDEGENSVSHLFNHRALIKLKITMINVCRNRIR